MGRWWTRSEQVIAPTGDAATPFPSRSPTAGPRANTELEVFLNGTAVETKDFEVKA